MKRQNLVIASGAICAVILFFGFMMGPSFNRLFISDKPAQGLATNSPAMTLSIDRIDFNRTSENSVQLQTTFAAYNQGKFTTILNNVQYGIYVNNGNTKIASGSIGRQTDDVIQGQESVFPVMAGDTLKISDAQTLTRSLINNETLWNAITNGSTNYILRGIYEIRDNSDLQASGTQRDFEIAFPPDPHRDHTNNTKFVKSLPLPNVQGRIDHMSIDISGKRLFIAELGNNSVDVIDLTLGSRLHSITGLTEPQGVLFIPKLDEVFVSNGGDGTVGIYNATSYSLIKTIKLESDSDNIRYDNGTGLIYVGYGGGGLAVLNSTGSHIADISLPGHPESFQIEEVAGSSIFVNVPSDHSIVLVDKHTRSVIEKWHLDDESSQNFPMALDERNHRLFVGFREQAKLVVFDTVSGKTISTLDISKDADDIFYDSSTKQIYVTAGEGFLDIFKQTSPDNYMPVTRINTAEGARTSIFVPELHTLYIAAPQRASDRGAELLLYDIQ